MLGRIYRTVKVRFDAVAQRLVWYAQDLYGTSLKMENAKLRAGVQAVARILGDVFELMLQLPRLDAVQFRSEMGSVIYVGERDHISGYLGQVLFPDGYEEIDLGRVALWRLPLLTENWLKENQLVCCRVSRFFPWKLPGAFAFDNPLYVEQVLTLDRPMDEMLAGKTMSKQRNKVNRMLKVNLEVRLSHSMDDLDMFYHTMYLPSVTQRHQDLASPEPYEAIKRVFEKGFLMFLLLDEQIVAGNLCFCSDKTYYFWESGLMDGDAGELEREISIAIYWFLINHAIEVGAKEINFMQSLAWVSNGVFSFKQHWRATARASFLEPDKLIVRANHLSDAWQKHINDIGFITQDGEGFLRVFVNETPSSVEEECELAVRNGLDGIQIVQAGSHTNYTNIHREQVVPGSEIH